MTDEQLVRLARAGDKDAFGLLLSRHEGAALRVAARLTGSIELSREVVQEAMLQAYLSLEHLRDDTKFGGWFYGIVLNVGRSYRRQPRLNFYSLESLAGGLSYAELPWPDAGLTPQELQEQRELHATVMAAVKLLSPHNRAATLLFYYEQLSVLEIAALLNISEAAVKGRLHKSRRQLRQELVGQLAELGYSDYQTNVSKEQNPMVKIKVDSVRLSPGQHRIIVLTDEAGERALPIWIGEHEANQILMALQKVSVARPLTYDFMLKSLEAVGATLTEVVLNELKGETFYATAKFQSAADVQEVDARPSDALALAVRVGCPLYASEDLMAKASVLVADLPREIESKDNQITAIHPPAVLE